MCLLQIQPRTQQLQMKDTMGLERRLQPRNQGRNKRSALSRSCSGCRGQILFGTRRARTGQEVYPNIILTNRNPSLSIVHVPPANSTKNATIANERYNGSGEEITTPQPREEQEISSLEKLQWMPRSENRPRRYQIGWNSMNDCQQYKRWLRSVF